VHPRQSFGAFRDEPFFPFALMARYHTEKVERRLFMIPFSSSIFIVAFYRTPCR